MRRNFRKTAFFHFWTKAMLWLNPFSPGIHWKIDIKQKTKNATSNGCISKARANSELKLRFSERPFNLLQKRGFFCTLYPRGYTAGGSTPYNPQCRCQWLAGLKELMQVWKTSPYVCVQKYCPENFAFLILRILELFSRKVCIFPINIFNVLCCFCMLCL